MIEAAASDRVAAEGERPAILLVDDEESLLLVYSEALGSKYAVTTATSAKEAEFKLRKQNFRAIVSDHLMPGGNGMGLLVRVREEYPEMQRLLVTGYMKPEMLLRSVNEAAIFRYLLKPVALSDLVRAVDEAVAAAAE